MPILTHEERVGTLLAGRYRIDGMLGRGGMGVVFKGTHAQTLRPVAIKLLNYEYTQRPEVVTRFMREAKTMAALKHPHIVDVLDMGSEDDGTTFLVLEFLSGTSLGDRLVNFGVLSPQEAAEVLLPIMDALSFSHENNVVHRDLKPDNIYESVDGSGKKVAKLLDFGIAKTLDQESTALTQTGLVMGTPEYMSPEQAAGMSTVGPWSDVWSMAVVWYECLSGAMPTGELSGTAVLVAIAMGKLTPLSERAPWLPMALCEAIDRALNRDPAQRYETMAAFRDAIAEVIPDGVSVPIARPPASAVYRKQTRAPAARPPVASQDAKASVSDGALLPFSMGNESYQSPVETPALVPAKRRSPWLALAVAAMAAGAIGAVGVKMLRAPTVTQTSAASVPIVRHEAPVVNTPTATTTPATSIQQPIQQAVAAPTVATPTTPSSRGSRLPRVTTTAPTATPTPPSSTLTASTTTPTTTPTTATTATTTATPTPTAPTQVAGPAVLGSYE